MTKIAAAGLVFAASREPAWCGVPVNFANMHTVDIDYAK
jgi:hypothetical protein